MAQRLSVSLSCPSEHIAGPHALTQRQQSLGSQEMPDRVDPRSERVEGSVTLAEGWLEV
jgi:hypothetical protein